MSAEGFFPWPFFKSSKKVFMAKESLVFLFVVLVVFFYSCIVREEQRNSLKNNDINPKNGPNINSNESIDIY